MHQCHISLLLGVSIYGYSTLPNFGVTAKQWRGLGQKLLWNFSKKLGCVWDSQQFGKRKEVQLEWRSGVSVCGWIGVASSSALFSSHQLGPEKCEEGELYHPSTRGHRWCCWIKSSTSLEVSLNANMLIWLDSSCRAGLSCNEFCQSFAQLYNKKRKIRKHTVANTIKKE